MNEYLDLTPEDIKNITRLEVIDKDGRQYVIWNTSIEFSLQDDGKTLKIFVNN